MKGLRILFSIMIIFTLLLPPLHVDAATKLDIVFIIDRSGSMQPSINNVRNQIGGFTDLLAAQGIDYRIGLITYERDVTFYPFTSNVNTFKTYLSGIPVTGGVENGLDAIHRAINGYTFDINAAKYFVLIGDEHITSGLNHREIDIINSLKSNHIILTSIGIPGIRTQFENISSATGGLYLDLYSNFQSSLASIFDQIQTIPTLSIVTPTPNQVISGANTAFIPEVYVEDPDSDRLTLSLYVDSEPTPRQTRTVTNTSGSQVVSMDAVNMTGFSEGNHSFRFTVFDQTATVQEIVSFRVDKTPPALGTVTFTPAVNSITIAGTATDAMAGMDTAPYRYTVGANASGWLTQTSYTRSSLTPNTAYGVKFEARDRVGLIAAREQTLYTLAQTPTMTIGNSQLNTLEITFTDSNPAVTQYQIQVGSQYINSAGNLTASPTWITPSGKRVTLRGLAANTAYSIQAKARNQAGLETAFSGPVAGRTLANPPGNITLTPAQTSVAVSWSPVSGATAYQLEVNGNLINNGTATSYTHTNLMPNTQHQVRVRTVNQGGIGPWSSLQSVTTLPYPPGVPGNITSTPSQRSIQLNWNPLAEAETYEVEADGTIVYSGSQPAYLHQQLTPKTNYSYRIRGVNRGGAGSWTASHVVATLPDPPGMPVNLTTQMTKNSVLVLWPAVEEATAYEVEVDGLILENGEATQYDHQGLLPLSGHTYRVRGKNIGGKGPWSEAIHVTTHPEAPVVPTNLMAASDDQSITLTWYQVPYAESYEVEINGGTVVNVADTVFIHSGLNQNTEYSYRVRARNVSGASPWSRSVTMSTMGDEAVALTNLIAVVTNHSILLSWDAVDYHNRFEVEVDGLLMDNGTETIYNHTGLEAEAYHTYKIRVKDASGDAKWYAILSLSTLPDPPDAPGEIEAFSTHTSIELRWERIEGATGYDVEVNGTVIDNGMLETFLHDQLLPATSYYYRVRAKNMTGVTAWSPLLTQSTTSPTYLVQGREEEVFELSLLAYHVQDFSQLTFVVTYDPQVLEVVDLYSFTPEEERQLTGVIPGTPLSVTFQEGRIEYRMEQSILPGTSWTGEMAGIQFRFKADQETAIDFIVE